MLELTCLGHATLFVRFAQTAILCDPILGDAACGGGNVFSPQRTVRLDRLPSLDAVLISHHHSDHFALPDLGLIPGIREQRILVPDGSEVVDALRRFGCVRVEPLHVGQPVVIGDVTVIPTPSSVDFPEVGFLFRAGDASALNLVDTQIHGVIDQLLTILGGPVQMALAPFQAGGYMSLLPLRVGGPPSGLIEAIARWSDEYTREIVEDLSLVRPGRVVPFADGLVYRDEGINAWHFPLPDEIFLEDMASHGVPGFACSPGAVFSVSSAGVEAKAGTSELVAAEPRWEGSRSFNPNVRLNDVPMSCADWNPALRGEATVTWADLCATLSDRVAANVFRYSRVAPVSPQADYLLNWFLELCDRPGGMSYLYVERGGEGFRVRMEEERPKFREYGLRLHGQDLLHLLEGRILLEHITLGGAFRYHSPLVVDDLERIRGRVFDPLYTILGMD